MVPGNDNTQPSRQIPLEGASNFRDLGGYETADGRRVRWRTVFRSGALNRLTPQDMTRLEEIGLRTVCDFRHHEEASASPSRLPAHVDIISLPIRTKANLVLREQAKRTDPGAAQAVQEALTDSYRCYVRDHADVYSQLFHRLADARNHPLMFHCSAGKDRTGFGAALLLLTLGVPEDTVFSDYLLTNTYWTEGPARVARGIPPAIRTVLLAADAVYLRAAVETLHETHESLDGYLTNALKLDVETVTRLRNLLLE